MPCNGCIKAAVRAGIIEYQKQPDLRGLLPEQVQINQTDITRLLGTLPVLVIVKDPPLRLPVGINNEFASGRVRVCTPEPEGEVVR
jgi:hypothetical protein